MKRFYQLNFLLLVSVLLLVNCTRPKQVQNTDYEQLYAVWHDYDYKDSLALTLSPAVKKALVLKNTAENRSYIDSVLSQLRWTRDSVSFLKLSGKAIKFAKSKSDEYMLANTYNNIGMYYHDLNVLDSTFYYYIKAENVYRQIGDSVKMGEMEFYQARLLFEKGLHMESEVKASKALHYLRKFPLNPIPIEANQLVALCLMERKDYSEAKLYLLRALELMQKDTGRNKVLSKDRLQQAISAVYINLSEVVFYMQDFNGSSKYADIAISYLDKSSSPLLKGYALSAKARADFMLEKKYKRPIDAGQFTQVVEATYDEALKVKNYYIANTMAMIIADMFLESKNLEESFMWAEKAYTVALEHDMKLLQREALEFIVLHKQYVNKDLVKQVIELNRTLEEQDYMTRNRFARIAYETEKIQTENLELKKVISILIFSSILIILTIVLGVYIYRLKNKNREISLIKNQQEINQSIYELIVEKGTIATEVKTAVQNRIAKDIHDGIVNGIFTIRFNLQQLNASEEELKKELIAELQHLESSTRDISHSLLDSKLSVDTSFLTLVEELVLLQKNQWNTSFALDSEDSMDLDNLSALEKVNIYLIVREALHNVNKHSKATQCIISFTTEDENVVVKIKDNGIGFDVNIKKEGIGLASMYHRVESLGSKLVIHTEKGHGVEVSFVVST